MKMILLFRSRLRFHAFGVFSCAFLILLSTVGCGPSKTDLEAVSYTPIRRDDWKVSTPAEQKLNPMLVAELYYNAAELETIHSLLVIKNGYLIAEQYFNGGSIDEQTLIQSASKSYISALVGIAIEEGCLSSASIRR